jgi:hypothetical protein
MFMAVKRRAEALLHPVGGCGIEENILAKGQWLSANCLMVFVLFG